MGLNEYQASALTHLLFLGEIKATTLSKASGVPSARVYGVLDELSKMGLITVRPGRPTLYKPRSPEEISSSLVSSKMNHLRSSLKSFETYAREFTNAANELYLKSERAASTIPLLRIVSVGEVSLKETRELYSTARKEILILSKAMEYLPSVADNLKKAVNSGILVRAILMQPNLLSPEDKTKQEEMIDRINREFGSKVELRFSEEVPMRGCIIDPRGGGKALFLVEDPGVPLFVREAAITSHPSVVNSLSLTFNLMWEHLAKK